MVATQLRGCENLVSLTSVPQSERGMQFTFTRAWTRALFPFQFWPSNHWQPVTEALRRQAGAESSWSRAAVSSPPPPVAHSAYYLEYLPHVQRFLFDGAGETGCEYLRIPAEEISALPKHAEVWLGKLDSATVALGRGPSPRGLQLLGAKQEHAWKTPEPFQKQDAQLPLRVSIAGKPGIETWISKMGVGVMSISLTCEPVSASPTSSGDDNHFFNSMLKLNHAIATAQRAVWLRDADGPPTHLHQIARELIRPLRDSASTNINFLMRGMVFTAIEAAIPQDSGEDDGGGLAQCQQELSCCLPHLAQIHPPSHPGEAKQDHSRCLPINNQHLCYIDQSGAAHAAIVPSKGIVDETASADSSTDYAHGRLSRIQREYFPGFLLALIQRLCLQRILDESTAASAISEQQQQNDARTKLFDKVLRFGLEGEFVQVAWRTTVQKHHELAQQACEVHEGLSTVRRAMNDFNHMVTSHTAEVQRQESERNAHVRHQEQERAERTMQVLEVFIVTFYSVELAHILGDSFHFGHFPINVWPLGETPFVAWSLIAVAVLTFLMAALLVSSKRLKAKGTRWTIIALFTMASTIHAGFLGANAWWKHTQPDSTEPSNGHSVAPQHG